MKREIDAIGKFILAKHIMYDLVRDKIQEQLDTCKKLGLMRFGFIYSLMQRQIQKEKVESNIHDLGKFRGLYALLIQESFNVFYVYDKLMGKPIRRSFLYCHWKDDKRPEENQSGLIDDA